jgi:Tetratricopeptide repeat
LAGSVRLLGADHPDTLSSRNNLAYAYEAAGDPARAIPLLEQTLADSVRVMGADHPQTKAVRANLTAARQHL